MVSLLLSKAYFKKTGITREPRHWLALEHTQESIQHLSSVSGIPRSELIQIVKGGYPEKQGTWIHPRLSIRYGIWLSDEIGYAVEQWIDDWKTDKLRPSLPYHLQRYLANRQCIPYTHFSILSELTLYSFPDCKISLRSLI